MASYEASVKKFKNAANQSAKIAALKDVERDYSKVAKGIMQAAKAANMSKSQMKDLKNLFNKIYKQKQALELQ